MDTKKIHIVLQVMKIFLAIRKFEECTHKSQTHTFAGLHTHTQFIARFKLPQGGRQIKLRSKSYNYEVIFFRSHFCSHREKFTSRVYLCVSHPCIHTQAVVTILAERKKERKRMHNEIWHRFKKWFTVDCCWSDVISQGITFVIRPFFATVLSYYPFSPRFARFSPAELNNSWWATRLCARLRAGGHLTTTSTIDYRKRTRLLDTNTLHCIERRRRI